MIPSRVLRPTLAFLVSFLALGALLGCAARRASLAARRAAPVASAPAAAQPAAAPPGRASLAVTVLNDSGGPADFADVTLSSATGQFSDIADAEGRVTFSDLPAGEYEASAVSEGRTSDTYHVVLASARAAVTLTMSPVERVEQIIEVNASGGFSGEFISKIPLANRNVHDIVTMMPGVIRTGAADPGAISIGGGTGAQVGYRVDGISANAVIDAGLTQQIASGAIESFKLITNGASAKYGEQSTGVAAIVTTLSSPAGVPGPAPHHRAGEGYRALAENPFRSPLDAPLSTFGIDVDTASYTLARTWLDGGELPPPDAVRIEEFVNAFRYEDEPPRGDDAFEATAEVAGCPWAPEHRLVRVAIKGAEIEPVDVPPANLVFLIDVSGSMGDELKLPLVQQALRLLVERLRAEDSVGIVVYAGAAGTLLEPTSGDQKGVILAAIDGLGAGGSTAGAEGIQAAYALAEAHFREGGINRVILATDGDFNVGVSSEGELVRLIEKEREKGIFLSVLGFGMGNYQDAKMEQLADHGNGNYAYVDGIDEARRVLVAEGSGTLYAIAKDVKIQVEMNPLRVAQYRLIGYENRVMPDEDFDDDAKDGGEIGAGHSVTALYEIVPATGDVPAQARRSRLRYQEGPTPSDHAGAGTGASAGAAAGELMTVAVRWKLPEGSRSDRIEMHVPDESAAFEEASADLRWSAAAAAFAMKLRGSENVGDLTWPELQALAQSSVGRDEDGRRAGMLALVRTAASLQPESVGKLGR